MKWQRCHRNLRWLVFSLYSPTLLKPQREVEAARRLGSVLPLPSQSYVVGFLHGVILPCLQSLSIPGQTQTVGTESWRTVRTNTVRHCCTLLRVPRRRRLQLKSGNWSTTNWFGGVNSDSVVKVVEFLIAVESICNLWRSISPYFWGIGMTTDKIMIFAWVLCDMYTVLM